MNELRHPGSEDLLAAMVGTLPPGAALVVRAHVQGCTHCRVTLSFLRTLGGALARTIEPEDLSLESRERVMAALEAEPAAAAREEAEPADPALLPHGGWLWAGPGLKVAPLLGFQQPGDRAYMLQGRAGARFPRHGHRGVERIAVLQGAFDDGGRRFREGDYVECDAGLTHRPAVSEAGPCLCLMAIEGRFRFTGLLGWIAGLAGA